MYILAIDQGTTSTRVVLYNNILQIINTTQKEVIQIHPQSGWLEHNAEQIFYDLMLLSHECIEQASSKLKLSKDNLLSQIISIGITNQRETTVLWDKTTGKPVHNAIVWQDRRTSDFCTNLKDNNSNIEQTIQQKTGLLIDPYFSASKINWLLHKYNLTNNNNILFGTIDSFIIWKLTSGKSHYTDITNASRTQIYNINNLEWDNDLLDIFNIPKNILPEVKDCADNFGKTDKAIFGAEIPINGVAGDQQAAAIGQFCINPQQSKITYGTGCFVLQNIGKDIAISNNKLITTIAYKINNKITYALEGSIFVAGAAVQWLRDSIKIINKAEDTEEISRSLSNTNGVYFIPAFTGLGAPYWDPNARGAIIGITQDTSHKHIVRAALEAVCYQTRDLLSAFTHDSAMPSQIRVDGGMATNNWLLQFLADITRVTIEKPQDIETTVKGAAILAGIGCGMFDSLDNLPFNFNKEQLFTPNLDINESNTLFLEWQNAISRVIR